MYVWINLIIIQGPTAVDNDQVLSSGGTQSHSVPGAVALDMDVASVLSVGRLGGVLVFFKTSAPGEIELAGSQSTMFRGCSKYSRNLLLVVSSHLLKYQERLQIIVLEMS